MIWLAQSGKLALLVGGDRAVFDRYKHVLDSIGDQVIYIGPIGAGSVAKLVLSLVEFLRLLMERQAIRRMDEDTLASEEVERVGVALMKLEETVHDIAKRFGLQPEDLNLDLGPLGKLH